MHTKRTRQECQRFPPVGLRAIGCQARYTTTSEVNGVTLNGVRARLERYGVAIQLVHPFVLDAGFQLSVPTR
jgi:hypothetical protein